MRVGAFEVLFGPGRGGLNKNFPKIQMPGELPGGGGMLKLQYLTGTLIFFNFSSNFRSKINILFLQCFPMTMLGHHNDP